MKELIRLIKYSNKSKSFTSNIIKRLLSYE
jgi:hypothetical protein